MNVKIKIPSSLKSQIDEDLKRKHSFAFERVGFILTSTQNIDIENSIVYAREYFQVDDNDYIKDSSVGAKINSQAIRKVMQKCMDENLGCFHVHTHCHDGEPAPSYTDSESLPDLARSFHNVSTDQVNGFFIFSNNSLYVQYLNSNSELKFPNQVTIVGYPMKFFFPDNKENKANHFSERQSFLGKDSSFLFDNVKVGVIGFGGGGSHIGQQLGHIGLSKVGIFDDDLIEPSNMNRLIGGRNDDLAKPTLKVEIAKRLIEGINPKAKVQSIDKRWQDATDELRKYDIVVGCVDSYLQRDQLESFLRRHLIPLVDIGMDVYEYEKSFFSMSGQIILSMPGCPCSRCYGFVTNSKLKKEAAKYGNTGGRPQVVWPNGILASSAIGVVVDLITGWTNQKDRLVYIAYDGNKGHLIDHVRLEHVEKICNHYPLNEIGNVELKKL